jgi:nucleotide-binding universal stress UspA family protein
MALLRQQLEDAGLGQRQCGAAVRFGDPGMEILRFARTTGAHVIVMGAAGAERPERPAGPVTSVVAARSECPVLTVPRGGAGASDASGVFTRIVCGVDLAPSSAGVLQQALSLGWETNGQVTCVSVQPDEPDAADVRNRLLAWLPPGAEHWCALDVIVRPSDAGAEIVRIADAVDADLIVIGAPRRWTSTAHAVLGNARRSVLVTHDVRPLPWPAVGSVPKATTSTPRGRHGGAL